MKPTSKSKDIVEVLFPSNSVPAESLLHFTPTQFVFHYIPVGSSFNTDAWQKVSVWKSSRHATFIRVVSTELAKTPFDILYSGCVVAGRRRFLQPSLANHEPVEALYRLNCITKEVYDAHMEEVRRSTLVDMRHEAEREFEKKLCDVGLVLNKAQLAKVAKHFRSSKVSL